MSRQTILEEFYNIAISMLATPVAESVPMDPMFSIEETPCLLVYLGPSKALPTLRKRLPPETFLLGLHDDDSASSTSGRTILSRLGDGSEGEKAAVLTSILPQKKVRVLADDVYQDRFPEELEAVRKQVKVALNNFLSEERRGLIRLRAACCNLEKMALGPRIISGKIPADARVILCGAGPSLANELDVLQELKDSVVIAAVGHAVRTLDSVGIVPDIVIEGDALAGCNWPEELRPDALLVATAEVAPEVADRFDNILWCAGSSMPFNQVAGTFDFPLFHVALNKTVSVHALDYLIRIGFRSIALIGQDYCYGTDGRLYAEPSRKVDRAEILELPAADGLGVVVADESLKMLWEAFNHYIAAIHSIPDLEITNCSGGAALEHTTAGLLSEWGRSKITHKPDRFFTTSSNENLSSLPREVVQDIEQDCAELDNVLKACRNLLSELTHYPIRINLVKRRQTALQEAIATEDALRMSLRCAPWLHSNFYIADRIMAETPGLVSEDADPEKQLLYLSKRYRMVRRLCQDLLDCVERTEVPHRFSAYLEENLDAITVNNPSHAELLRKHVASELPAEFSIHWFNQLLPNVSRNGIDLSAGSTFFHEARAVVDSFVRESGFDPSTHALTIIAPGNWVYVYEFVRRFPQLEMVVIDVWPQLTSKIIRGGCFLHRLPPTACVVSTWADPLYVRYRNNWRSRGLQEVRFVSERVADMPDVEALCRNMALLG